MICICAMICPTLAFPDKPTFTTQITLVEQAAVDQYDKDARAAHDEKAAQIYSFPWRSMFILTVAVGAGALVYFYYFYNKSEGNTNAFPDYVESPAPACVADVVPETTVATQ